MLVFASIVSFITLSQQKLYICFILCNYAICARLYTADAPAAPNDTAPKTAAAPTAAGATTAAISNPPAIAPAALLTKLKLVLILAPFSRFS